jgi:hypothetical protein
LKTKRTRLRADKQTKNRKPCGVFQRMPETPLPLFILPSATIKIDTKFE